MIKSLLSLLFVLILATSTGSAGAAQPTAYLSLFDETGTVPYIEVPAPYMGFYVYVFAWAHEEGFICADFKMEKPADILYVGTEFNAEVIIGIVQDLPYDANGARVCLSSCRYASQWLCRVQHLPTTTIPGMINLLPRPSIGQFQLLRCTEGNPPFEVPVFCNFGINLEPPCTMATKTSAWGAIKGIYYQ